MAAAGPGGGRGSSALAPSVQVSARRRLPVLHPSRPRQGRDGGADRGCGSGTRGAGSSAEPGLLAGRWARSQLRNPRPRAPPPPLPLQGTQSRRRVPGDPRPGDREALPARPQATLGGAGRCRARAPRGLTFLDVSLFSASAFGPEWPALRREKTH